MPSKQSDHRYRALFETGRYAELEALAKAKALIGNYEALFWQGVACVEQARYTEARHLLEQAAPHVHRADAWDFLGSACHELGDFTAAAEAFKKALALKPSRIETWINIANNAYKAGWFPEAAEAAKTALQYQPQNLDALLHRGAALKQQDQLEESMTAYQSAMELDPANPMIPLALGDLQLKLGNFAKAEALLRRADEELLKTTQEPAPALMSARLLQARALFEMGRLEDAASIYREILKHDPESTAAYSNLGVLLHKQNNLEEAETIFRNVVQRAPDDARAWRNLGMVQQDKGEIQKGLISYERALSLHTEKLGCMSSIICAHNYLPEISPEDILQKALSYGSYLHQVLGNSSAYSQWRLDPNPQRRLRVGLVSGDLKNHPVGFFLEGVLRAANGLPLDFVGFPTQNHSRDTVSLRLKDLCIDWIPLAGLSDERAAKRIYDCRIDILIDLSGHTAEQRLSVFARKPSPIQITWLGYFGTTGVPEMDYVLADPWSVPSEEEWQFTEKVWRLPETRLCFTPPAVEIEVSELPAIKNGYITLGCFNNLIKMNDEVVALWARIMLAIPNARLFLKTKQLEDSAIRANTLARFATHGVEPERLRLEGPTARQHYLACYNEVDFALDPYPFNGGTTSVEGMWMGVPMLTLKGNRMISRQGELLLMNTNLPDWIAQNQDDYVAKALQFAANLSYLAKLRKDLRPRVLQSPIFDAKRFSRNFEAALRKMWLIWLAGATNKIVPRSFLYVSGGGTREQIPAEFLKNHWQEIPLDIAPSTRSGTAENTTALTDIRSGEVDALFSPNGIEQLSLVTVPTTLKEFYRVLQNDGFCVIAYPTLKSASEFATGGKLEGSTDDSAAPLNLPNGHISSQLIRCGFTQKSLMTALKNAGFARVGILEHPGSSHLWAIATKMKCSDEMLNQLMDIYLPPS